MTLPGGWRLERWSVVYEDGREEFPMGPDAQGYILYTPGGQVSAIAYAGRYEIADGTVFHSIELSTDPTLIGVRSRRRIALDGDCLILSGPDFTPGTKRLQRIVWHRA